MQMFDIKTSAYNTTRAAWKMLKTAIVYLLTTIFWGGYLRMDANKAGIDVMLTLESESLD